LLPATRSVRLLLSDGRTITSPAIRVPTRLGGPAGLYYQAVRGPSPIPTTLTELDAAGHTLVVLNLPAVVECFKKVRRYLPGGVVHLVQQGLPQGPTFVILAERYRELGHVHFELKLNDSREAVLGSDSGGGRIVEKVEEGLDGPGKTVFAPRASTSCEPQPSALVYGLLKDPGDTVLAQVSGGLVSLQKLAIPAHLHAGGVLAYGLFSSMPTSLLIRDAHGKTIATKNLGEAAKSDTETCEGESEG
jgi:hypothetical protein